MEKRPSFGFGSRFSQKRSSRVGLGFPKKRPSLAHFARKRGSVAQTVAAKNLQKPPDDNASDFSDDNDYNREDFVARPFECAFWTKVQTPFGTRTRYWNWQHLEELDGLNSKLFAESPLLYSSLIQLREVESLEEQRQLHSLLIGLEGSAPGKAGAAGKHDAGGKSKPYGAWCGLKWRYFGECTPPVPASVGGMRVSVTKPLLHLCIQVCSQAVQSRVRIFWGESFWEGRCRGFGFQHFFDFVPTVWEI